VAQINQRQRPIREAPMVAVRQKFRQFLNEVQRDAARIVITKRGKPIAALIDIRLFERLRKLEKRFKDASRPLGRAFAQIAPEKGTALVDEAVKAARRQPSPK